jgi:integrase/recombinase XerD
MISLFDRFVQERQYIKNVAPTTVLGYRTAWRAVQPWLPSDPALLTPTSISSCIIGLRERGLAPAAINCYFRAMNAFFRWLHEEGHVSELLKAPRQKQEQKLIEPFSSDQVKRIIAFRSDTLNLKRVHILCCLLIDTGLRIEEALNLKREDVDFQNLLLKVMGTGRKERVIPFSFELRKLLYRWLQTHDFDWAFATRNGTRISYRNAARDFVELGKKLQINGVRVSFHTLRHTFAHAYIQKGGSPLHLQRVLGHSTLEMTKRYVLLSTSDLSACHNRLSLLSSTR